MFLHFVGFVNVLVFRFYQIKDRADELHFKVEVKTISRIYVCGANAKDSLKYAQFYLDVNVTGEPGPDYVPSNNRVLIHGKDSKTFARRYFVDECTLLFNLPTGKHVLSVKPNPDFLSHTTTVTHVITFK